MNKLILDAGCGGKHIWLDKNNKATVYIDIRKKDRGYIPARPNWECQPDIIADTRKLPFKDNTFKLIVWDPPHIKRNYDNHYFGKKYGILSPITWPSDLKNSFNELWRVLNNHGILTLKFSNSDIPFKKVLRQFHVQPLFGTTTSRNDRIETRWFTFMKL